MPISNRPRMCRIPSGPHRREEKSVELQVRCVEWENALMELMGWWLEWSWLNQSAVESGRIG